jgi:2-desacetyl-2-hydroxyethyl bacteriochlorophyllide A dehydrogenase
MRHVVLEQPSHVHVVDRPVAAPRPGEALVRLRLAGICGSDLSAYRGTSPLVSYPCVLGHELLVDVVDAPSRPELAGQRAVIEPLVACGSCTPCRKGRQNCCVNLQVMGVHRAGGLAETSVVDANRLYIVPPDIPDDVAVLAEPTTIAYRAVQRSAIEAGQIAVVIGAGAIGLLICQILLRARGCQVYVIDIDERRLATASTVGAHPLRGDRLEQVAALARATGGELASVVFEATGNASCTRATTEFLAYTGRIVLVGWNKGPVDFDTVTLMRKEAEVFGSRNSTGAFPPVLRLLQAGVIDADAMITHRFALQEAEQAITLLDSGAEHTVKVVITPT